MLVYMCEAYIPWQTNAVHRTTLRVDSPIIHWECQVLNTGPQAWQQVCLLFLPSSLTGPK